MFTVVLYYGIYASIPTILLSIFLYPRVKDKKFVKLVNPLLFCMQYLACYSFIGLIYLGMLSLLMITPDDASLISIFIYIIVSYLSYKFLPHPKKTLYTLIPSIAITLILLCYWITSAVKYGFNDSIGWLGYGLNAIPFGNGFIKLLQSESTGVLHIVTAIIPIAGYYVGINIENLFSKSKKSN